jgi:hypothetical protein
LAEACFRFIADKGFGAGLAGIFDPLWTSAVGRKFYVSREISSQASSIDGLEQ